MSSRLVGLALLALGLGSDPAAQPTFGVTAGAQAATVSFGADGEGSGAHFGLVAGVFAEVPVRSALSFRPEVLYSQKGYTVDAVRTDGDGAVDEGSFAIRLAYLEVPLLLRYTLPAGTRGLVVGVEVGPALGYLLGTGVGCSGFSDAVCAAAEGATDLDDAFRDVEIGGAIGATVGAGPFDVGLRVTQGFTAINDGGDPPEGTDPTRLRNRTFAATLHYRFGGGPGR